MSTHILTIEVDTAYANRFPDFDTEYKWHIYCPNGNGCSGWQECYDVHAVEGYDGDNDGPYESEENAPWYDEEEFEFHGEVHTYKDGYGWTMDYPGCVVAENDYEIPDDLYPLRPGRWEVDDDWDDGFVSLSTIRELKPPLMPDTDASPETERQT